MVEYIITFTSSHHALKAEQVLNEAGWKPRLIASPRAISSQCGFCLLLADNNECALSEILTTLSVSYTHLYTRQSINGVRHYAQQD
ncbi:DUF3343 domain-containing protein [Vibrio quintilis]|nr:DUF3343 domain-containing protein [Vibrio quintilis]